MSHADTRAHGGTLRKPGAVQGVQRVQKGGLGLALKAPKASHWQSSVDAWPRAGAASGKGWGFIVRKVKLLGEGMPFVAAAHTQAEV